MLRSLMTIIRKLSLYLTKVIFMLKHSVKLRRYIYIYTVYIHKGESNGKLPPRTCPGFSVPEPYQSHDWALVPAKPGLQG